MGSPLYIDGVVVEKISEDIVLVSNEEEERVVRLDVSSANLSTGAIENTPLDDDDSPILRRLSSTVDPCLLGGEIERLSITVPVRFIEDHQVMYGARPETGYVLVTNFRIVFVPDAAARHAIPVSSAITKDTLLRCLRPKMLRGVGSFPLCFIHQAKTQDLVPFGDELGTPEQTSLVAKVSNTMLRIRLVDGRNITFEIPHTHLTKNREHVTQLMNLVDNRRNNLFALSYNPRQPYTFDGWSVYNFFREMRRIFQPTAGILVLDESKATTSESVVIGSNAGRVRPTEWRVVDVTRLCPTYPKQIAVPRHVTDEQLSLIASHRTRGRIPALVFLHPVTSAALIRCSQPLSGITQTRSEDDEFYFREMIRRNPSGQGMVIYDARPFLNAAWNRGIKGAGYENEEHYQCKVFFLDVPNIHKVRDLHEALLEHFHGVFETPDSVQQQQALDAILPTGSGGMSDLSVDWLNTLSKLLDGALRISKNLRDGVCVTVHCSDGWDRTPQLTSLAMLLCDPWYRTLMGFQTLIEWQWVAFGHKFGSRLGFCGDDDDISPVFLQWLDCCWQLLQLRPQEFEFNEKFLCAIAAELHSGRFGTFLADSGAERAEKYATTQSFWSSINSRSSQQQYLQKGFQHDYASGPMWASDKKKVQEMPKQAVDWNVHVSNLKLCRDLHVFFDKN